MLAILATAAILPARQATARPAMTDPHTYCRAVKNADVPDARYRGQKTTDEILRAAREADPSLVVWRCMGRKVYVCAEVSATACGQAPWRNPKAWTVNKVIQESCKETPSEQCAPGTHCIFAFKAGSPVLNRDQYPVDTRGFSPQEWRPLAP